jgi:ABC-type uncharacterized transport system substrate-binding protein
MRRREFITLLGGTAATWPLAARAQQSQARARRIGMIASGGPASFAPKGNIAIFQHRLTELGYELGTNLIIEGRWHEGHMERLPVFAGELVTLRPDLIVASGPEAALQAVLSKAGTSIPIVMAAIDYDPLAGGYIRQLNRPGGNVTGVFLRQVEVTAKRLELLKEMLPSLQQAAVLWDAFTTQTSDQMRAAETTAQRLGVAIEPFEIRNDEFESVLSSARQRRIEAVLVLMSPAFFFRRAALAGALNRHKLPASFGLREFVEDGGLMSYGANLNDLYVRLADYVDRILKGANPAETPVEQPTKFELIINQKVAQSLGVAIPPSLLVRADEVIE